MRIYRWLLAALLSSSALSACTLVPVQPWQRDVLARPSMQLEAYPLDSFLDDHVYFSKEGALGGRGIGGGGCGCN